VSDVNCPYCGDSQEINHDDGYGYDEAELNEQQCVVCDKLFKFQTSISYCYEVFCVDGDHQLEQSPYKETSKLYSCKNCDYYEVKQ